MGRTFQTERKQGGHQDGQDRRNHIHTKRNGHYQKECCSQRTAPKYGKAKSSVERLENTEVISEKREQKDKEMTSERKSNKTEGTAGNSTSKLTGVPERTENKEAVIIIVEYF